MKNNKGTFMIREFNFSTIETGDVEVNPAFFIDYVVYIKNTPAFFSSVTQRGVNLNLNDHFVLAGSFSSLFNPKLRRGRNARIKSMIDSGIISHGYKFDPTVTDTNRFQHGLKIRIPDTVEPGTWISCIGRRGLLVNPGDVFVVPASFFEGTFQRRGRLSRKSNGYLKQFYELFNAGAIILYSDDPEVIAASENADDDDWVGEPSFPSDDPPGVDP